MLPRTWASFSSVTGANSISQSMAWDHWNLLAGEELDYAVKIVHLLYGFYFFSLPQKNTNYTYFPFFPSLWLSSTTRVSGKEGQKKV
jgi:hypothetical protein